VTLGAPLGTYHVVNVSMVNKDTWSGLTDEQRRAFMDAGAHAMAATTYKYVQDGLDALEEAKGMGITVHEASPELVEQAQAFVEQDLATIEAAATENGVQNAGEKIARFRELVTRWEGLTAEFGLDVDKLTEVYKTEIFDKLDPAAYGM
jgi:TRAP-type mannitol/chloroaromatic compound transport system substrate-binding protein